MKKNYIYQDTKGQYKLLPCTTRMQGKQNATFQNPSPLVGEGRERGNNEKGLYLPG